MAVIGPRSQSPHPMTGLLDPCTPSGKWRKLGLSAGISRLTSRFSARRRRRDISLVFSRFLPATHRTRPEGPGSTPKIG